MTHRGEFMTKKNKLDIRGFSLVEITVVVAILIVLLAVLTPSLLRYTENSRMQKDESAMDELCNAIKLAMADSIIFDEVCSYAIPNNYITYTDSSGIYASKFTDEEFWAPDGSGHAVTITFNPDGDGVYTVAQGIVNDMTYGNGSVADSRTAEGLKQCYFNEMGDAKLYHKVEQTIGATFADKSATYKNSSYTVFIAFDVVDGIKRADIYGEWNGTNLTPSSPASLGSGTNSYDANNEPEQTKTGGTTQSNFTTSDLTGGGGTSGDPDNLPSYKQNQPEEDNFVADTFDHDNPDLHPTNINLGGGRTTPQTGDTYRYGDYEYCYNKYYYSAHWLANEDIGGWGVRPLDTKKTAYGPILESINGTPIACLDHTFYGCTKLVESPAIPLGVHTMKHTYYYCPELVVAPMLHNNITCMDNTFQDCYKLATYPGSPDGDGDFSKWQIPSSVTTMRYTFAACRGMIIAPKISDNVKDMHATFYACRNLTTASRISSNVETFTNTYADCTSLITAPSLSNCTKLINMTSAFSNCSSLSSYVGNTSAAGDFSRYKIPGTVTNMQSTFSKCSQLTVTPVIPDSVTYMLQTFYQNTSLVTASKLSNNATNLSGLFSGCTSLTTITNIPQAAVDMSQTFNQCTSLQGVPSPIPESVTKMTSTFTQCQSLTGVITINATSLSETSHVLRGIDFERQQLTLAGTYSNLDNLPSINDTYCRGCNGRHITPYEVHGCRGTTICEDCGVPMTVVETEHEPYQASQTATVLGTWDYSDARAVKITVSYESDYPSDYIVIAQGNDFCYDNRSVKRNFLSSEGELINGYANSTSVQWSTNNVHKVVTYESADLLTGTIAFYSNASRNNYLGYTVIVTPIY